MKTINIKNILTFMKKKGKIYWDCSFNYYF